jgi:hypothetical protein
MNEFRHDKDFMAVIKQIIARHRLTEEEVISPFQSPSAEISGFWVEGWVYSAGPSGVGDQ